MVQRKTELRRGNTSLPKAAGDITEGSGMADEVEDILFSIECEHKAANVRGTNENADQTSNQ